MAAASHRGVDSDSAALVVYDGDCTREGARDDPCRKYDGAGFDGRVLSRTRSASIDRTGVETWMSTPRRWSTRDAVSASFSSSSGRIRGAAWNSRKRTSSRRMRDNSATRPQQTP
jgi:hypothetical protein